MTDYRLNTLATVTLLLGGMLVTPVNAQILRVIDVPQAISEPERSELLAKRATLLAAQSDFLAKGERHNTSCRAVEAGSARDVQCREQFAALQNEGKTHNDRVRKFNAKVRGLDAAETKHRQALNGLAESFNAFYYASEAAVATSIREAIRFKHLPVLAAAVKAPGPTLSVIGQSKLLEIADFLDQFRDCSYQNPDLKTSCENMKRFAEIALEAQKAAEEIRLQE